MQRKDDGAQRGYETTFELPSAAEAQSLFQERYWTINRQYNLTNKSKHASLLGREG